jgi:hypothetical protein
VPPWHVAGQLYFTLVKPSIITQLSILKNKFYVKTPVNISNNIHQEINKEEMTLEHNKKRFKML